jgi:hypothetical protein
LINIMRENIMFCDREETVHNAFFDRSYKEE